MISRSLDLVEETIAVADVELTIVRPRSSEALLDEEAFEREEFLPYWAELWPSSLALARALTGRELRGARVVELGCGLGVASIVAALRGARVLATDWSPDAVAVAATNAARNRASVETAAVDWTRPGRILAEAPWDLVVAADVLYERRNVAVLLDLLPRLADEVLVAEPGRPHAKAFLDVAARSWTIHAQADPAFHCGGVYSLSRRKNPSARRPRCSR